MNIDADAKVEYIKIIIPETNTDFISARYKTSENMTFVFVEADNKVYLKTPKDITVCYITQNALYQAKTQLLSLQYSNYTETFVIKTPEEFEKIQVRKFFRVKIDIEAEISFKTNNVQKSITCRTFDLSAGGIRLILKDRPEIPNNVSIKITFDNKTLNLNARLVKCYYNNNIPQASFEFIDTPEKDIDFIASICFKKQMQDINARKNISNLI